MLKVTIKAHNNKKMNIERMHTNLTNLGFTTSDGVVYTCFRSYRGKAMQNYGQIYMTWGLTVTVADGMINTSLSLNDYLCLNDESKDNFIQLFNQMISNWYDNPAVGVIPAQEPTDKGCERYYMDYNNEQAEVEICKEEEGLFIDAFILDHEINIEQKDFLEVSKKVETMLSSFTQFIGSVCGDYLPTSHKFKKTTV